MYVEILSLHCSSNELYCVPGAGLQSPHTAAGGARVLSAAVGAVFCLVQHVTIDVEECIVTLPAVYIGLQAEAQSPGSRHRHSEDPCVNVQWCACDLHVVGIREGEAVIGDGADCGPATLVSTPGTFCVKGLNFPFSGHSFL